MDVPITHEFTVDESKWYRGKGGHESKLLRIDGLMCCLGFLGESLNVPCVGMLDKEEPGIVSEWPNDLVKRAKVTCDIINVNDEPKINDNLRKTKLVRLFASLGIRVTFKSEVPA